MERSTYRNPDMAKGLHVVDLVALILVIIGGLNWGIAGLTGSFNLVHAIFGFSMMLERLIYILVGAAAVYVAVRSPALAHLRREEPVTNPPHPAA